MPNDAREAERARWPGDFASATGGSSAPAADDRLRSHASTRLRRDQSRSAPRAGSVDVSRPSETVPIPINFHGVEIGAVLVNHLEMKRMTRTERASESCYAGAGRTIERHTISFLILTVFFLAGCASFTQAPEEKLNVEKLTPEHIARVQTLVAKLEPFIKKRDLKGELPSLTFKKLESPLNSREKRFLHLFRNLKPEDVGVTIPFHGFSQGEKNLVRLNGQKIRVKGKEEEIPPRFLSRPVYQAFQFMMGAMESDIGKRLFVESGYRSNAYQLYLFVYHLSDLDYSIRETAKWVALPGYSEHGDPEHLALDLINSEGINGKGSKENAAEFDALPENQWLLKNADRFGFVLSYPKNAGVGIAYEPWHWRYVGAPQPPQS